MRIDGIALRELTMRLKQPFETSTEVTWDRRILLVEVYADGLTGWGEITAEEGPYYNSEFTDSAWLAVRNFIAPRILGRTLTHPSDIAGLLAAIRGHEMARGGVDAAAWHLYALVTGISLSQAIGGTRSEIPCGVSIGIHHDPAALLDATAREVAAGYQRIKMKIKPELDLKVLELVRARFGNINLMADANSAYSISQLEHLKRFDALDLMMIEQPLAWDDLYYHSVLQKQIRTPICLDECIHNLHHAEAALAMDACRVINIKLGRVCGFTGAKQIHELCYNRGVPVWCGGMLESGIGRAHNIALSTLPGFSLPGDVSASRRYWDEDIIDPEICVTPHGTIEVPTSPGLGYVIRYDLIDRLTVRREVWRP